MADLADEVGSARNAEDTLVKDLEEQVKWYLAAFGLPGAIGLPRSYTVGVVADAIARFRGRDVSRGVKVRIENCVVTETLVIYLT